MAEQFGVRPHLGVGCQTAARVIEIDVPAGLEPILPDGLAGEIIRAQFLPRFRESDFSGGVLDGVRRVVAIVEKNETAAVGQVYQVAEPVSGAARIAIYAVLPFLLLMAGLGFYVLGAGIRALSIPPMLFGLMFGGLPVFITVFPQFEFSRYFVWPLALAMAGWAWARGKSMVWTRGSSVRVGSAAGESVSDSAARATISWNDGSSSSESSSSSSSSDFGGGDSGGGGASGRW